MIDYKQKMRSFVIDISRYSRLKKPNFYIVPQNGIELITEDGNYNGPHEIEYLEAIHGNGQEDLFYGYTKDDKLTPKDKSEYLRSFLKISQEHEKIILVTDYCSTPANVDDSFKSNNLNEFISFAASKRELNEIPIYPKVIVNENNNQIKDLADVKNFLYLIDPGNFKTKKEFIDSVASTNYDLLIMDLFFNDKMVEFSSHELEKLRMKSNGGTRLLFCYMSIGEAEKYRYYWDSTWKIGDPDWLEKENPCWEGNYKVKYWNQEWQAIIYGYNDSYLDKILNLGFDGVYLDIIDAYEYFE